MDYADSEYQGLYGPWINEESGFLEKRVFGKKTIFFENDLLMLPDDRGHSVAYKKLF